MRTEIQACCSFFDSTFLRDLPREKASAFKQALANELERRYDQHWHASDPVRGSGFRALRWDEECEERDDSLLAAAAAVDVDLSVLPALTVWVDPDEVCARIGAHGSIFIVT